MEKTLNHGRDAPKARGDADSPAHEAAYALWDLWRLWKQYSRSVYKGERTFEQHFLLRRIARRGSMTVSELADELGITPGAATIATRRLEKAGLLRKERSEADQRVVTLSLTPAGKASLDELEVIRLNALIKLLEPLDPDEKRTLATLVQKVTYAMRLEGGETRTHEKDD
ncbi:MAG TPA: MarR family transcriptional regulator [Firmicutes bacterium]|nr:MarR family transcriptional regulator [Bacillota bacterium]